MTKKLKYKDYESALERLEEITDELESGDTKLENAIKMYTEGLEIAKFCDEKLNTAESQIKLLMDKNGQMIETDFEGNEE